MTTQGKRLKQLRTVLGFDTQKQLADAMGIEKSQTISRIENELNGFSDKNIIKLVEVCHAIKDKQLNLNWLLLGIGEMFLSEQKKESFKDRLNQYQAESGKDDIDLARETGISESRIEKLGTGKAEPTLLELTILKRISGKSLDWWEDGE